MKGGGSVSSYQIGVTTSTTKRRWKGFVIAVLGLVLLSMLVPLVFLLGFHNAFLSPGFPSEQRNSVSHNKSGHIAEIIDRLVPAKDRFHIPVKPIPIPGGVNETGSIGSIQVDQRQKSPGKPAEHSVHTPSPPTHKIVNVSSSIEVTQPSKAVNESEMTCELRFGSYCLWRREYKEVMKDSVVKKMKDRLFVARAYFPSIAKLPAHEKLSKEMKQNIQDFERILSEATSDADLPSHTGEKLRKMDAVIARAKSVHVDFNNVDKKFRQLVDLTEDEANFHTKQSAFLYQLAVQTMPKSLHCLSMRLTVEYFNNASLDVDVLSTKKFTDPDLYHYVVFSSNILASTVLINSTVVNSRESKKLVFHVLTDRENFYSMKVWFIKNTFKQSAVQVLNLEDYIPGSSDKMPALSLSEEFRATFPIAQKLRNMQYKTEYVSLFSHSHYLLPEIFKKLHKIVVLDDDILVQQDLSALWKINMGRKVNGASEMCAVRLSHLSNALGKNRFNKNSCAWMSGLNVVDLARWRELNLTGTFRKLVREFESEGTKYEAAASRASLLTFEDLVHPLEPSWVLSGLGHDYGLSVQAIKNAAALHYNGNMKPWLEIGIPKYKRLWVKFLNRDDHFLSDCNFSP